MAEATVSWDREMAEGSDEEVLANQENDGIDLRNVIQKVHEISKISHSSPQHLKDFKKSIKIVDALEREESQKLKLLNLILNVKAVNKFCQRNDLYWKYRVTAAERDVVSLMVEFLQVFREASKQMSAGHFPTLLSSLLVYTKLMHHIKTFIKSDIALLNPELKAGLEACKEKLEKYFDKSTYESEYYYAAADHQIKLALSKKNKDLFSDNWQQENDKAFHKNLAKYSTPTSTSPPSPPSLLRLSSISGMSNLFLDEELLGSHVSSNSTAETADVEYAQYLAF
ncbi:hypothetical protein PM082_007449 [Marasmius tenuissimus]|nr:hypothetical protein PM082_007449 [Marasmius tenuissimus]